MGNLLKMTFPCVGVAKHICEDLDHTSSATWSKSACYNSISAPSIAADVHTVETTELCPIYDQLKYSFNAGVIACLPVALLRQIV